MGIITLTTDFGLNDEYVGVMKGVILSINPSVQIIDISHLIAPQDIMKAALTLKWSYPYFPENSIHVCVVDPGVGGTRKILGITFSRSTFLAPDNGILSVILGSNTPDEVFEIQNRNFCLKNLSHTFHGRDIFAPVAAHLSKGVKLEKLGRLIDTGKTASIKFAEPFIDDENRLIGEVLLWDRFGNLLTNIDEASLVRYLEKMPGKQAVLSVQGTKIYGMSTSYDSVKPLASLMIIGSRGHLEISVNCASAKDTLGAETGTRVSIGFEK